ncbi:interleukin-27 subunit alpha isoform X2 [Heterocephalus glaber]|uniref:Interleukin-27 subunit alpha n=1 Tax=Heterocephalus glaber TaxID=10181 RepID=A0AAX6PP25_HETGA|nr:interleukin-27 subunit alpha isoform X2 [Heterocephalus glaber]
MGQKAGDLGRWLSLLPLSLLLVQASVWGFPRPPGASTLRTELAVSLHLTRKLLSEVQGQAHSFAESHLSGVSLDLLPLPQQLPSVSLTFQAWRHLPDPERLCLLSLTLRPFHALLRRLGSQGLWSSSERMRLRAARLDLRDLQRHLRFQGLAVGVNLPEEEEEEEEEEGGAKEGTRLLPGPQVSWPQLLYSYQLLHSLELVLSRAVRDFLLLSKAAHLGLAPVLREGPASPLPFPSSSSGLGSWPSGQPPAQLPQTTKKFYQPLDLPPTQ